jgi:FkbM family methyltransferase
MFDAILQHLPERVMRPLRIAAEAISGSGAREMETFLDKFKMENVFFVQIGANDGKQGDPLHRAIQGNERWRGIFVEPVPFVFERLKSNYNHESRFLFVNAAVAPEPGVRKFYYVSQLAKNALRLPYWYDQIGSFSRTHIRRHFGKEIDQYIVCHDVQCVTVEQLLCLAKIKSADVFYVDAEGFDYEIVRQIPFGTHSPRLIIFEHRHMTRSQHRLTRELLVANGYKLSRVRGNTVAELRSD